MPMPQNGTSFRKITFDCSFVSDSNLAPEASLRILESASPNMTIQPPFAFSITLQTCRDQRTRGALVGMSAFTDSTTSVAS